MFMVFRIVMKDVFLVYAILGSSDEYIYLILEIHHNDIIMKSVKQ